jgi:hypothetical protein
MQVGDYVEIRGPDGAPAEGEPEPEPMRGRIIALGSGGYCRVRVTQRGWEVVVSAHRFSLIPVEP